MWLTTGRRWAARWGGCAAGVAVAALALAGPALARGEGAVDRLGAIMDYLQSDYAGAVVDGRIVAPGEYQEQRGLLEEARSLVVAAVPAPRHAAAKATLAGDIERLVADFRKKVAEGEVAADCREVQGVLFDDYALAVGPLQAPSAQRARELFVPNCAPCHGEDGRAQTETARSLLPPPVSFLDGTRLRRISPRTAFEALEFGVNDTAMASFEALAAADRWSLAFTVIAWRHEVPQPELDRGEVLFRGVRTRLAPTPSGLSELTDAEIDTRLTPALATASDRAAVLAWLRTVASFSPTVAGPFHVARALLQQLVSVAGDPVQATVLADRIFEEGVRPQLLILRLRDLALARRVEDQLRSLRRVATTASEATLRDAIVRAEHLLDRAEECDAGGDRAPWLAAILLGAGTGTVPVFALVLARLSWLARARRSRIGVRMLSVVAVAGVAAMFVAFRPEWMGISAEAGFGVALAGALIGVTLAVGSALCLRAAVLRFLPSREPVAAGDKP